MSTPGRLQWLHTRDQDSPPFSIHWPRIPKTQDPLDARSSRDWRPGLEGKGLGGVFQGQVTLFPTYFFSTFQLFNFSQVIFIFLFFNQSKTTDNRQRQCRKKGPEKVQAEGGPWPAAGAASQKIGPKESGEAPRSKVEGPNQSRNPGQSGKTDTKKTSIQTVCQK